jgi:serine/threonine protein kinase
LNKLRSDVPKLPFTPEQPKRKSMIPLEMRIRVEDLRVSPFGRTHGKAIGFGGYGRVTLESDPVAGRVIAVKRIGNRRDTKSFAREVEILVKLRHPCIVRILGWSHPTDSQDGEIHMEYAANGSLAKLLSRSRNIASLDPTRVGIIISDIILGMRYVHSHRILHRDLKPSNILLDKDFRAKVGDFGISRADDAEDPVASHTCTLNYSAPEQLADDFRYTTKTDVFLFGLVLYEILSGTPFFDPRLSPLEIVQLHQSNNRPAIPAGFGTVIPNIIRQCWCTVPERRPSFQAIFQTIVSAKSEILPNADRSAISKAISEVIAWEEHPESPQ